MSNTVKTVHDVTYELLRTLGLTTVFGNPGSTEQSFLRDFPDDFTYVLALQEASVLAIADGFAQATGKPALVNLHTAAGTGNAMGSLVAAYKANTPMIVTAGQQTREMLLTDPYLANREETVLPQPWVKWAYQPARAQDVPAAFMQAYAVAMQPPRGPVFLSIPLDDWDQPALGPAVVREVTGRVAPDADRLRAFAERISRAQRPLLVLGPEVDRDDAWDAGIAFAEKLKAPVFGSALPDRVSFPEDHPLSMGPLPMTIAGVNETVRGHDLVIVIGAAVFRYYPYVPGDYLPEGTELLHITSDPHLSSVAPVGDSLIGSVRTALEQLVDMIEVPADRKAPEPHPRPVNTTVEPATAPLTADQVYHVISQVKPDDAALVNESTSTLAEQLKWLPTTHPRSFFATGSGGIGWGVPAAVGIALGDRARGVDRHVVATIGDGSFQYSVQAIYTAAQHKLPVIFVVLRNGEYAILKSFAELENTPGVPGLDLPGLDIASLGAGFGLHSVTVDSTDALAAEFKTALNSEGPTVIVVHTQPEQPFLG
ncbi:benzoylformate decarboxylase [Mycobacterium intermedium]|uniref:acetolactate synthase n=1 Tax=Mycobacterium intermedium TaxID=28445 RepID=A0A1E3S7Z4_MYCIE|nr:benzoylformate decarboxylase [Mycobacterium intermedium]MCV6962777.1 benzoylformate decarboxylase [Mycobacterium intermedium]ODQ98266.1 benzoylformate decarboxylase [Mycobacterium intermedium]OPE50599.1 benzoylformate decarboxylase [Mycobacterium intermedium]ORB09880.1 benzoylformate decarboxylase [Mycobacterium intermedium]